MKFKDLKLKVKLSISFGAILLILAIIGLQELRTLNVIHEESKDMVKSLALSDAINESKYLLRTEMQTVMELLNSNTKTEISEYWQFHLNTVDNFDAYFEQIIELTQDETWGADIQQIKDEINGDANRFEKLHNSNIVPQFEILQNKINEYHNTNDNELRMSIQKDLDFIDAKIDSDSEELFVMLNEIEGDINEVVDAAVTGVKTEMLQAKSEVAIFILLGIIISIILAAFVIRSITIPLEMALKHAKKIASGDLIANINLNQKDEVGQMVGALSDMTTTLRDIVGNIKTGSDNIAAASQQLSSGSQQVSSGVSEQAASAEEVSSSMEEMAANIQQNSSNAIQTRDISANSSNAMEQVATASEDSMNAVNDIYAKINVVVQIAEKTDLLAINAAVEAARAGDQGRGFAVVAAEVRKLAERSQTAATEIVELADRGMKMTKESTNMLKAIVPEIQETSRLVDEISSASREQEAGAEQVNSAIQQLSMVTQQNASASEEMASSSEELSSQAAELEEITRFFKVDQKNSKSTIKSKANSIKSASNRSGIVNNSAKPTFDLSNIAQGTTEYIKM